MTLSFLATILGALLFTAAPALAAAPEAPDTEAPNPIAGTSATFNGVLNPGTKPQAGTYEFLYKKVANGVGCEGESATPAGIVTELEVKRHVSEPVGLEPNTEYTVCLAMRNTATPEEMTVGNPISFKTLAIKPTIYKERAQEETATEARLFAAVNANNESTECHFQYGRASVSEHEVPCEHSTLEGGEEQYVGVTVTGLTPDTSYQLRVILKNAVGTTEGTPTAFTTPPEAPETTPPAAGIAGIGSTTAVLRGVLNPHARETNAWYFEYNHTGETCYQRGGNELPSSTTLVEPGVEGEDLPVSAEVVGLQPDTRYTLCLVAQNAAGDKTRGGEVTFTTTSDSNVGSSSATLHGQVDPQGEVTSYFFEYGTTTAYGSRTPVESAGAGSRSVSVSATIEGPNLEGLQPDTTYRFRLVASNANGTVHGGDGSFSTLPVGLLGLPDGRGYELVSPLEDGNATVVFHGAPVRAAADGSAVAYQGTAPPVGGNGNGGVGEELGLNVEADNAYLAERSTSGGWTATDIQPDGLNSAGYTAFSSELSVGILGSEQAVTPGGPSGRGHTGLYTREEGGGYRLLGENATYAGSTPDGSHLLVSTSSNMLEEVELATGKSYLINVLPGGGSAAHAVFGGPSGPDLSNVISNDGSRVFWTKTDGKGNPEQLFVSEGVGSSAQRTVQLDASHVAGVTGGGARFVTATSDGSRVFFIDCNPLTPGSTAVPTPECESEVEHDAGGTDYQVKTPAGDDLYEYDAEDDELTDLTVGRGEEHANVVGVLGASEDSSYVYFAAGSVLASGAEPQECIQSIPFERSYAENANLYFGPDNCNIYVVHDGGAPQFVTTLPAFDGSDWNTVVGAHPAYVAANGQLTFDSHRDLTGFHSADAAEIYIYNPGSGLSCVSCNPSGALTPPGGGAQLSGSSSATFALRDVSADGGRVFFETSESLVARDQNGLSDVYEWEASGEGGCVSGDSAYSAANGGCLYLLSSGTSSAASVFMDASESGDDVFIETRADLVPRDRSEAVAVYDVRVGATEPTVEPQCTGSGCQGVPAAPPIFATPSSVTFNGVGNFPPPTPAKMVTKKTVKCGKGKKLSKGRCVKAKPKRKHKQSGAKKSTHRKGSK